MAFGVMVLFFGAGLAIKADVGIGTFDAFVVTIADVVGLSSGKIAILANFALIMTQIFMLGKKFPPRELLQFPYMLLVGFVLDLYVEVLLVGWMENSPYIVRLAVSAVSNAIRSLGVMIIFESKLMQTPLESVSELIGKHINKSLGRVMQYFDVFFIVVSLALSFFFKSGYRVREGTAIALLLFGPLMDVFRKPLRKVIEKLHI